MTLPAADAPCCERCGFPLEHLLDDPPHCFPCAAWLSGMKVARPLTKAECEALRRSITAPGGDA